MVIWLLGLSGVGKTTIAEKVFAAWRRRAANVILVDGDDIREVFSHDSGAADYTLEERYRSALRIQGLCAWLDRQDMHVVCTNLGLFHDVQDWNREHFSRYFEVYVEASLETVIARDPKGLYAAARSGETKNVVGIDLPFNPPKQPDLVISNDGLETDIPDHVSAVLKASGIGS